MNISYYKKKQAVLACTCPTVRN